MSLVPVQFPQIVERVQYWSGIALQADDREMESVVELAEERMSCLMCELVHGGHEDVTAIEQHALVIFQEQLARGLTHD